ncbi:M15 family metallopeptidase [Salimicrobium flavidum]|uniref:Peptidoglycan L-alanyl-D-glutamate endopeptidase CwlK n=1 Tax=Salimicrobium flavidum TaxID=570947 RepID=A0A1N7J054_9BACI|nr:M15 family metallopeptidase [Salimicrobium flavidum]SIS42745.1 peptidoglycan L-alanyl-D-glutamate endopeptidase CwlK [Salimicrobium flavidum]
MPISKEELLKRSTKNMGRVHPLIAIWGRTVIDTVYEEGIFAQITEGKRSYRRQASLYGQGRPGYEWRGKKYGSHGKIVTNAKPGQSIHNYGFALDFCLVDESGQQAVWIVNEDWRRVASVAKVLGFTWGGNWTTFQDYPHLEWTHGMSWKELANGASPFDYPGFLLRRGSRGKRVKQAQIVMKVKVDGIFGPKTERAVCHFQKLRSLQIDGIIGPYTWNKFYI